MILVDNSLLSLSSLCLAPGADPMIPAGTHLRWNLSPELGFSHAGFRLRVRQSSQWPWSKADFEVAFFEKALISEAGIKSKNAPIRAEGASLTQKQQLHCVSRKPIRFVYDASGISQPFIRFAVALKDKNGGIPKSNVTLKGFSKPNGRSVEVASMTDAFNKLPVDDPFTSMGQRKSIRFVHVSHEDIEYLTLTAADNIIIEQIYYTTANFFHELNDWQTINIFQPLCELGTSGVFSPTDPLGLAKKRLVNSRPLRRAAEPLTAELGKLLTNQDHEKFERRILMQVQEWSALMTKAFQMEILKRTPPVEILISQLDSKPTTPDIKGKIDFPFYGLMQASSFEPHIAHMLGLAFFDKNGADGRARDYAVDAIIPEVWLQKIMLSIFSNEDLKTRPETDFVHNVKYNWLDTPNNFVRLASFSIDKKSKNFSLLDPPEVSAIQIPRPSQQPVQADVLLTVRGIPPGTRPLVFRYTNKSSNKIEKDISLVDPVSSLLLGSIPDKKGFVRMHDSALPSYTEYNYGVKSIDAFGRASKNKKASPINIEDNIAPLAPNTPEVTLGKRRSVHSEIFDDSSISFVWGEAAQSSASDISEFELLWKAGHHKRADLNNLVNNPDGSLTIPWPNPPGISIKELPDIGLLLTSTLNLSAQNTKQRWEVTVVCRAKDSSNNLSPLSAPGYGIFTESIVIPHPLQPKEPQWSSWPDAQGNVRWRCRWNLPQQAVSSRLLIASEQRILQLSRTQHETYLSLSSAERTTALKKLAKSTPNAFIPSELALPVPTDYADVVMKSGELDWRVAVVEFISKTGQKSDWPKNDEAFAVIRPRTIDPIRPPVLNVDIQDDNALIDIQSTIEGEIKIYTTKHPKMVQASIALGYSASLMITPTKTEQASIDLTNDDGWIGFFAILQFEDGRRSDSSNIIWRKK